MSNHARANDHGGKPTEKKFWEEHGKRPAVEGGVGYEGGSGRVDATNGPVVHVTNKK